MWFPYTLPSQWKAECDRERVRDSHADTGVREFLVGFYLRNPVSQEWQVELHLEEPQWIEFEYQGSSISAGFYPHDEERLAEILCRVQEKGPDEAVRYCYGFVIRLLNCWAAWYGRGFGIDGYRVADLRHEARWRAVPHRPSSELFTVPDIERCSEEMDGLFELYRTVRTANSPVYRFLCAYKLSMLLNNPQAVPFNMHELAAAETVTKETLVISGMIKYRPELEGRRLADLPEIFQDWRGSLFASIADTETPGDPLEFAQLDELGCISNLLDITCHRVLSQLVENTAEMEKAGEAAE